MIEKKVEFIVDWLREQVKISHTNGILVGLSGGIDSSVVANLIKRAFPDNCIGVVLPCKSNPKDKADAIAVAEACDMKYVEIELSDAHTSIFDQAIKALGSSQPTKQLTDGNLRARLRMSALYTISSELGYLVAGTDNAAELYTGYFTKYGDGGVDILPIARLSKAEVFEWAKHLNVPQSVIDRKPSAGLWEGQTDEDEMGVTYDAIDAFLQGKKVTDEELEIIERMNRVTEHKRNMPPMAPEFA
ncbi:MAG: NAD(+) synthase [Clostridia bacterium]|nr:NAD(+) synthase [Clostridia bacterium]